MDGMTGEGVPHAYGINAAGEVVGDGLTDYRPHAALWTWKDRKSVVWERV